MSTYCVYSLSDIDPKRKEMQGDGTHEPYKLIDSSPSQISIESWGKYIYIYIEREREREREKEIDSGVHGIYSVYNLFLAKHFSKIFYRDRTRVL